MFGMYTTSHMNSWKDCNQKSNIIGYAFQKGLFDKNTHIEHRKIVWKGAFNNKLYSHLHHF